MGTQKCTSKGAPEADRAGTIDCLVSSQVGLLTGQRGPVGHNYHWLTF